MRLLAWVLAICAVMSSSFVGWSWFSARGHSVVAAQELAKHEKEVAEWNFSATLSHMNIRNAVTLDEKRIENDDLDVQIAEMENRSIAKANQQLSLDNQRLAMDEMVLRLDEDGQEMGSEDSRLTVAKDRASACRQSLLAYRGIMARDERLAWGCGFLLVAYGFAFALAARR